MTSFKLGSLLLCALALEAGIAGAKPLVYRVTTIADGSLGTYSFSGAIVTVTIHTDSLAVTVHQVNGSTVYENHLSPAVLTIQEAGRAPLTAHIASGQLFARYDTTHGVASLGSLAGGFGYPFMIGCSNYPTCTQDLSNAFASSIAHGIPTILAAISEDPAWAANVSSATVRLPASLGAPTFLNGQMSSCFVSGSSSLCLTPVTAIPTVEGQPLYITDSFQGNATAALVIFDDAQRDD